MLPTLPDPANPLAFTVGGSGLYSATMTGSATLEAAKTGTIRLRVDSAGNLAPAAPARGAAPLALIDEDKLRDIMIMATVRMGAFASGGRFVMEVDMLFATGRR
jgi:hypothetical protein